MKKMSFVYGLAFVLTLVGGILVGHAYEMNNPPSEIEVIEAYIIDNYGEGDYEIEILCGKKYGTLTRFKAYEDGELIYYGSINTEYFAELVE